MRPLDLNVINTQSPYPIWRQGEYYYFRTDHDIVYKVSFDKEEAFQEDKAYWFNLSNAVNTKSPRDHKIRETIFVLLEDFFYENPDILLYICDTANGKQAQRDRLFLGWFKKYGNHSFTILTAKISDEGEDDYVAMILQKSHPHYTTIVNRFNDEISMFKEQN